MGQWNSVAKGGAAATNLAFGQADRRGWNFTCVPRNRHVQRSKKCDHLVSADEQSLRNGELGRDTRRANSDFFPATPQLNLASHLPPEQFLVFEFQCPDQT
jgi:hypothetical protein